MGSETKNDCAGEDQKQITALISGIRREAAKETQKNLR
jgi:hypothetical protein